MKKRDDLRRKSALPDFLTAPENLRSKIANNHTVMPRMYRAHSQQGSERLELPSRMQRAYSHEGEVPCTLQPLSSSPHGRKYLRYSEIDWIHGISMRYQSTATLCPEIWSYEYFKRQGLILSLRMDSSIEIVWILCRGKKLS